MKSFQDNIKDFKKVHGELYLYEEETGKNKEKFNVTCRVHGKFLITPGHHKSGRGCRKCADEKRGESFSMPLKNEKELHSTFKKLKYKPLKYFGGYQECFTLEVSNNINFVDSDHGSLLIKENSN